MLVVKRKPIAAGAQQPECAETPKRARLQQISLTEANARTPKQTTLSLRQLRRTPNTAPAKTKTIKLEVDIPISRTENDNKINIDRGTADIVKKLTFTKAVREDEFRVDESDKVALVGRQAEKELVMKFLNRASNFRVLYISGQDLLFGTCRELTLNIGIRAVEKRCL